MGKCTSMIALIMIMLPGLLGGCTSTTPATKTAAPVVRAVAAQPVPAPPQPPPPIIPEEGVGNETRREEAKPVRLSEVLVLEARDMDDPELLAALGGDMEELCRLHKLEHECPSLIQDIREGRLIRDNRGFYHERAPAADGKLIAEGLLRAIERARNPFLIEDAFGPNPFAW